MIQPFPDVAPAASDAGGTPPAPRTPTLGLWSALRSQYEGMRPIAMTVDGLRYPETTAGDVRRSSLLLSRALCHPRFDFAQLADTRAAWRDALARAAELLAALDWNDRYPDNARFWLGDSLALAQQLGAVAARRNALVDGVPGPRVVGAYPDLGALWDDLLHWYCERRIVRRRRGLRYPETTVGDVRHAARTIDERAGIDAQPTMADRLVRHGIGARFLSRAMADVDGHPSPLRQRWVRAVEQWREAVERMERLAAPHSDTTTYPDNPRFWLVDAKRFTDEVAAIDRIARGTR